MCVTFGAFSHHCAGFNGSNLRGNLFLRFCRDFFHHSRDYSIAKLSLVRAAGGRIIFSGFAITIGGVMISEG